MAKPTDIASTTIDLFKLLESLEPDLRKRAIKAALTMLGDDTAIAEEKSKGGAAANSAGADTGDFNAKTRTWGHAAEITQAGGELPHGDAGPEQDLQFSPPA